MILPIGGVSGVSKRWFNGYIVVIKTAAGNELASTPNHPILTDGGWRPAQSIDRGSKVISYRFSHLPPSSINSDSDNIPAAIEDIAKTFFSSSKVVAVPMPTTSKDFHGDGVDGEIAIIGSDRNLTFKRYAAKLNHLFYLRLQLRYSVWRLVFVNRLRHFTSRFMAFFRASDCFVGGKSEALSLIGRRVFHPCQLLLMSVSRSQSRLFKMPCNCVGDAVKTLGYTSDADPFVKQIDSFGSGDRDSFRPGGTHWFISAFKFSANGVRAYIEKFREFFGSKTGSIFLDEVVGVDVINFSGHVYNLKTESGAYVANGIVTHNCRSTIAPVVKGLPQPPFTSYNDWLKRQPTPLINDILGPSRAKLFIDGKLPVDRFVNVRSGRVYTLDELARREATAWRRAGLSEAA